MMSKTQDNSFRISRKSEAALLPSLDMQNVSFDSTVQVRVNLKSVDRLKPANLRISFHSKEALNRRKEDRRTRYESERRKQDVLSN